MDLRRLEAGGDRVGLLRELVRKGLDEEARALALQMIQGGGEWSVEGAEGKAKPVFREEDGGWCGEPVASPRWMRVCGVLVPARWTGQRACLFACDVAEEVLPIFEEVAPEDRRPRDTVEVARRHAYGLVTAAEHVKAEREVKRASREVVAQVRAGVSLRAMEAPEREAALMAMAASAVAGAASATLVCMWRVSWRVSWVVRGASQASQTRARAVREGARRPFIPETVEPLFARWHLGEVPEYAE